MIFISAMSLLICLSSVADAKVKTKPEPMPTPIESAAPSTQLSAQPSVPLAIPKFSELNMDRGDGKNLTLDESIRIAILGATTVLKADNDLMFNGARLLQAYGQFLPSVVGSGAYNYNTGTVYSTAFTPTFVTGSAINASYAVTADLNIFNGLSDINNLKSALLKKDASQLTVERAKQEISLDVAQSFLQVILDYKLLDVAKKNYQASQAREDLLREQTEVGVRNLSDLFRQQAQTSQDESAVLSAQNKTRTDQVTLLQKLRLDVGMKYHFVTPDLPETKAVQSIKSEEMLVAQAMRNRFDLKASDNIARATSLDVNTAFGTYLPRIDFVAGLQSAGHRLYDQSVNGLGVVPSSQTPLESQLSNQTVYSVGVTLTWNIFDRFVTNQNVSQAQLIAGNYDIDARNKHLQVQGDVKRVYGDYVTAVQQLNSSRKGVNAAQKAYEVMDGRYGVGSASFLDLITTQTTLVQAESSRAQALVNFQLQDLALAVAIGENRVQ